jgi:hypothetical protein
MSSPRNWGGVTPSLGVSEAIALQEGGLTQAYSRAVPTHPRDLLYLSETYLLAGRLDDAASTAGRALHLCRATQHRVIEPDALRIRGEIHAGWRPPQREQAERSYRQAFALAEEPRDGYAILVGKGGGRGECGGFHPAGATGSARLIRDLRHTYTSLLIAQGAHPKYIQVQLGHASIQTTLDRYGHLMPDAHAAEARKLDQLVFGEAARGKLLIDASQR